jgi:hypothetical protein
MVELDLKSFHAQTLGYEAGCPEYIRLAKLDVHSFVAGNMLKLPHFEECLEWSDDELLEFLKWHRKNYTCPDGTPFQKVRDERAKVGVLAFGLGQMASSLFTSNRDSFLPDWYLEARNSNRQLLAKDHRRADAAGLGEAQKVHDALNERFPKLRAYRETTPLVAKKQGNKIISRYGAVRWFWDITHWDGKKQEYVHGTDWEKCISYPVQSDGHGYLRHALIRADERRYEIGQLEVDVLRQNYKGITDEQIARLESVGALERYGFRNTVHDSLVFCCHKSLVEQGIHDIREELERPSDVLTFDDGTGLSVEAEAKVGSTWGKMKEVK